MATFEKGHKKLGGRVKGVPNLATVAIKELLNSKVSDEELWKLWKKKLYSKDPHIATKALELVLHYKYGKPIQPIVGEELAPPIKIDISAIPTRHVKAS
jgi:hypothetical protein